MIKAELQLILLRGASGVSCDASGVLFEPVSQERNEKKQIRSKSIDKRA